MFSTKSTFPMQAASITVGESWGWSSGQSQYSAVKYLEPDRSCGHSAYLIGINPPFFKPWMTSFVNVEVKGRGFSPHNRISWGEPHINGMHMREFCLLLQYAPVHHPCAASYAVYSGRMHRYWVDNLQCPVCAKSSCLRVLMFAIQNIAMKVPRGFRVRHYMREVLSVYSYLQYLKMCICLLVRLSVLFLLSFAHVQGAPPNYVLAQSGL